jgi:ABC-2 type transport system ATP-binding protein
MTRLLGRLEAETLVLNLKQPLTEAPHLPDFPALLLDDMSLEVELVRGQTVNNLFSALSRRGIEVASLRNKQNRLERLFLDALDKGGGETS